VGSARKEESRDRLDGCVVPERRAAESMGWRLAVRSARIGDAFLAIAAHSLTGNGIGIVWRIRRREHTHVCRETRGEGHADCRLHISSRPWHGHSEKVTVSLRESAGREKVCWLVWPDFGLPAWLDTVLDPPP
jgi:hypothetical protein